MSETSAIMECLIRRAGGSDVDMGDGTILAFRPNKEGLHVTIVEQMKHVTRLLQIDPPAYKLVTLVQPAAAPVSPPVVGVAPVQAETAAVVPPTPVAPVPTPEPEKAPAPVIQPAPQDDSLVLPTPDADGVFTDEQVAKLREIFKIELGRVAPPKSKPETMVAQIVGARDERNKGGAA